MSATKKTESKVRLARIAQTCDLDARAKAWAKERKEPITAETYQSMFKEKTCTTR